MASAASVLPAPIRPASPKISPARTSKDNIVHQVGHGEIPHGKRDVVPVRAARRKVFRHGPANHEAGEVSFAGRSDFSAVERCHDSSVAKDRDAVADLQHLRKDVRNERRSSPRTFATDPRGRAARWTSRSVSVAVGSSMISTLAL